jgi:hypothetical protein
VRAGVRAVARGQALLEVCYSCLWFFVLNVERRQVKLNNLHTTSKAFLTVVFYIHIHSMLCSLASTFSTNGTLMCFPADYVHV